MDREIKFRGIRVDNGEWVYGDLFRASGSPFIVPKHAPLSTMGMRQWLDGFVQVLPESVGQFTGLKDSKGVEIYEGDIVKYGTGEHSDITEVYYNEDCCKLSIKYINRNWTKHTFDISVLRQSEHNVSEIIGNIFESKHLLDK